ncbi:MAG TPA: FmdB family zinc ribbon protein [Gemmatimonadaceae bacterium]|nr:FmdB family zinc ribbon protein [Gemmatimonadaceae bacterium]
MPLYEFTCPDGHDFEKFYRSINAAPAEENCPRCGAIASRLISRAGLVFKGSGFYITDYGKDGKKAERESAAAIATKADAAKGDTTKDAKPSDSANTKSSESGSSKSESGSAASTTAAPAAAPAASPAPAKKSE